MKRRRMWRNGVLAVVIPVVAALAFAQEETVTLDNVPKVVLDMVKTRFKDAELKGAGKETENDKPVYEVTIRHKGQHIDVTLTPDGELLMIEKEITRRDLPKAAADALERKYPKATYQIVEEIIKVEKRTETLAYYEALLTTADKQRLEVQVTAQGKIVNEEKKSPESQD